LTDGAVAATCSGIGEEVGGEGESVLNVAAVAGAMEGLFWHGVVFDDQVVLLWKGVLSIKVVW